jgi:hypothetical protein
MGEMHFHPCGFDKICAGISPGARFKIPAGTLTRPGGKVRAKIPGVLFYFEFDIGTRILF